MTNEPTWLRVQESFKVMGLKGSFLRVLGWQSPHSQPLSHIAIGQVTWRAEVIAELHGAAFIEVADLQTPSAEEHRKLAKQIGKYYPEHIIRFIGHSKDVWYWPRRLLSGGMDLESFFVPSGSLPDFLAQRLAGLRFTAKEHSDGLTVAVVRDRVRGSIETTKITNDFYKKFKIEHENLTAAISGIPEEFKHGYATLLLNRLMFIWFLQKKQFLNNDVNYLQTCLAGVQSLKGRGHFYSFYSDYLLDLFFNYLNSVDRSEKTSDISQLIGDIPYVNGGIFGKTDVERDFDQIRVPDEAFESIFGFFSSFTWHLDTRPTGDPTEINPEVIGYIFEQYINYTADGKKDSGAYYTQSDVTGYMTSQTIVPAIFDRLAGFGYNFLGELALNPVAYLNEDLLHGSTHTSTHITWANVEPGLEELWKSDPIHWGKLDESDRDAAVQLPDETWVETFHRRERISKLIDEISRGNVAEVNDLVTLNLNSSKLLLDTISRIDSADEAGDIFALISKLAVLDPTCGSGAFLFASLEALEPIYQLLIERFDVLGLPQNSPTAAHLAQATNRNYAIRKHIALSNLHGTDIMPDAIETAKLRIFLSLAATLTSREELEPLPDLDFNLRCGNLVVGFADAQDSARMGGGDIFLEQEIRSLQPRISDFQELVAEFQKKQELALPTNELKILLNAERRALSSLLSQMYARAVSVESDVSAIWIYRKRPIHWLLEFPEVMSRGGFDVIVGNPPYIKMSAIPHDEKTGYATRDSADFYAICYERSLRILAPNGRHAFIVMLSLSFSDRFEKLRHLIHKGHHAEWWSTYGSRPVELFPGVRVRNTMLILAPGASKYSTKHHLMTAGTRLWQFASMEYFSLDRLGGNPPTRGGIVNKLVAASRALSVAGPSSGDTIKFRGTGTYWFPVFFNNVPSLDANFEIVSEDDGLAKEIHLVESENSELVAAALSGKIGYLIWQASGDDFHVLAPQAMAVRGLVNHNASAELQRLARVIENASRDKYFLTNTAGKNFLGIRWNQLRPVTDQFDRLLLENAGLLEHWRPLNIWYRQAMRSTRENLNSVPVPREVVDKIWQPK